VQDRFLKLSLKTGISKGTVMKHSNLAERHEEFVAAFSVVDQPEPQANTPRILAGGPSAARQAPRRRSRTAGRIQIRDQGLRPFRVS
jgi:hypothetical protein